MKLRLIVTSLCLLACLARAQDGTPEQVGASADNAVRIYQTAKPQADGGYFYSYQVRAGGHRWALNPKDAPADAAYPADFRFSVDDQWLVRLQKIAAGESTLFLYHRTAEGYVPATPKRFGDMAWDYFFTQPEAAGVKRTTSAPKRSSSAAWPTTTPGWASTGRAAAISSSA